MAGKATYQYSRGPIGLPSVLLGVGWVAIWLLWPSPETSREAADRRRPGRTQVSYGVVDESLYMSPMLFARATRVGFRAPEEASEDTQLLDRGSRSRSLRFLHVPPPEPDFSRLRRTAKDPGHTKQVDGYRPVWKDSVSFAAAGRSGGIVVDVRGPLRERAYQPGPIGWAGTVTPGPELEIRAFVGVDTTGAPEGVFLERSSGNAGLDAAIVRALEQGRGEAGTTPVSGRVTVTIRRGDEGQD